VWAFARDTTLFFSLILLLLLFGTAGFASRTYHDEEAKLAGRWFNRGQAASSGGRIEEAVQDFRTAVTYARENGGAADESYELALAQSLIAAGHIDEACAYLTSLPDQTPAIAALISQISNPPAKSGSSAGPPQ
jgi:outer membrane protein assembly factor BamD (BamD/ComL family)